MASNPKKPGPPPEHVQFDGDWESAVGKALKKKRPPQGWPKPTKKPKGTPKKKPTK